MHKQLSLFDIPSFSVINLPPRENRNFREFKIVVTVGSYRLAKMVESNYYYIEEKVDIIWVDVSLLGFEGEAFTDKAEAFIHFGRCLEASVRKGGNNHDI